MNTTDQQRVFQDGEGDAWMRRNRAHLEAYDLSRDPIALALAQCHLRPTRILDLGCSLGTRLSALCQHYGAEGCGVEPSAEAVAAARQRDPQRTWLHGSITDHPPLPWNADIVILSFVLHWVDRAHLFAALASIDAAVVPGGHVLIHDFWPESAERRAYHHLPNQQVFTWKCDYPAMLEASSLYRPVLRHSLAYPQWELAGEPATRSVLAVLRRRQPSDIPER